MAANRYKTVLKKIILKLGKGLKSSKKEYCLGEEIDLQLEDIIVPSEGVKAVPPTDLNTLARWNKADGSELTGSKTTQDNNGNTTTTSTVDGELKELLENLSSSDAATVVFHLRSLVKTMIRQEIKDTQIWDAYIDATSKSYIVRGQNLEDPTQTGDFFQITRTGDNLRPFQTQALAVLQTDVPNVTGDNIEYKIGTREAWSILKDDQNNFFSGGSGGQPFSYTTKQLGTYIIKYQLALNSPSGKPGEVIAKIYANESREYYSRGTLVSGITKGAIKDTVGAILPPSTKITINLFVGYSGPEKTTGLVGLKYPLIQSSVFVYLLG